MTRISQCVALNTHINLKERRQVFVGALQGVIASKVCIALQEFGIEIPFERIIDLRNWFQPGDSGHDELTRF